MISRYGKPVDTSDPIWNKLFLCKYPMIHAIEEGEMRVHGLYSTGFKDFDEAILPASITTNYITIDKMIEFYKKGISVTICDREDTVKIYEILQEHLHAWSERLEYGLNIANAPIDDLMVMDEFAQKLFNYVRHEYGRNNATDELHNRLMNLTKFNSMKFKAKMKVLTEGQDNSPSRYKTNKDDDNLPKRGSFSDILTKNISLIKGF